MARVSISYRHAAPALLIASWAPWIVHSAVAATQPQRVACPIEVVGTWKLATATAAETSLLSFSPDGWANVLGSAGEHRPADLDILAQVRYEFVHRRDPRRIAFQTRRGNDVFPAGASSWEITAYTDESFSARSSSAEAGEQSHWTRVQTHRYFLTFAARGNAAAFVMWTTLDGSTTVLEALGTTAQGTDARFRRIPQKLTEAFATESERSDEAMMRVELSEAEYRRTREVFVSWDTLVSRGLLAREDPQHQALLLLDATLQSMNRCGMRIRTVGATTTAAGASADASSPLRPFDLIRSIRKLNDRVHVTDKVFPFRWKPPPAL